MKKIVSLIICTIFCTVTAFGTFGSYAAELNLYNLPELTNPNPITVQSFDNLLSNGLVTQSINDDFGLHESNYPYYFAYMLNGEKCCLVRSSVEKLCYDETTHQLTTQDGSFAWFAIYDIVCNENQRYSTIDEKSKQGFVLPDFDVTRLKAWTNMDLNGVPDPFDENNPPDVFTYSIDKPNFSLENGKSINVLIDFTPEFISWANQFENRLKSVAPTFAYDFVIYVSSVKPTDTTTLVSSLNNTRYVNLTYGEYIYEGGAGYANLGDNPNQYINNDGSSLAEPPTSHSGKSAMTTAQGVHICNHFGLFKDPVSQKYMKQTYVIPISLENIHGFDDTTPIYVCVLGRFSDGKPQPNVFNSYNVEYDLNGHTTPNDTYIQAYVTHTEDENEDPDYTLHNYYFPFDCVDNCVGNGYGGNCTYKPQIVNGKEYDTGVGGKVSDLTNKAILPDKLHDVDMEQGQWVKPEDYSKWQYDHYQRNKYDNGFDFDTQTLKDVFDQEGDFFKFLGSAFSIFPSYVMNIFIAFLVALLVIVLLKFIL